MTGLNLLKQFLLSTLGSIGFGIFFGVPATAIFTSGLVGGLGWTVYYVLITLRGNNISAAFLGALSVGLLGELLARKYKKPATTYIVPGIIPLVPGSAIYYTMLALVEKNLSLAASKGFETFFMASAISVGVIISTSLSRSIKKSKDNK